jgi:5-(carboxyamino)imidazole ribonucleotide synthase
MMTAASGDTDMQVEVPGAHVGVIGGGQLGRMATLAAHRLGVRVTVLDPTPGCPAAAVGAEQVVAAFDDAEAVTALASRVDVLTYEIELADPDLLDSVGETPVHPSPETLRLIQDKHTQNSHLRASGIETPRWVSVQAPAELADARDRFDGCVLKAREGGYDGRGVILLDDAWDDAAAIAAIGGPAIAEEMVPFVRELSVIGVRGRDAVRTYHPSENIHRDGVLRQVVVPPRADDVVIETAIATAQQVIDSLEGRGVFGIELFETVEGDIVVNEVAPRPHNSGHWTIEAAPCSQFENFIRAVLGWPTGATTLTHPVVMANLLADVEGSRPAILRGVEPLLEIPGVRLHWYGKAQARPGRKMGHITVPEPAVAPEEGVDALLLDRVRTLTEGVTFNDGAADWSA